MNRYKFRIWDKEEKKMLLYDKDIVPCLTLNGVLQGENHTNVSHKYILMQSTGLKDKRGRMIFDGDIIEVNWNDTRYPKHIIKSPVHWDQVEARWDMGEGGGPEHDAKYHYEVIGNIYQDSYLLDKE